jgi:hypothetical protein
VEADRTAAQGRDGDAYNREVWRERYETAALDRAPVARTPDAISKAAPADIARFCSEEVVAEVLIVWQEVIAELHLDNIGLRDALGEVIDAVSPYTNAGAE